MLGRLGCKYRRKVLESADVTLFWAVDLLFACLEPAQMFNKHDCATDLIWFVHATFLAPILSQSVCLYAH